MLMVAVSGVMTLPSPLPLCNLSDGSCSNEVLTPYLTPRASELCQITFVNILQYLEFLTNLVR